MNLSVALMLMKLQNLLRLIFTISTRMIPELDSRLLHNPKTDLICEQVIVGINAGYAMV